MPEIGYLTNRQDGLYGQRGDYYDYIIAQNGVFIEAETPLITARIPVETCEIRGLAPVTPWVVLRHGRIPGGIFQSILQMMLADARFYTREVYAAITWNGTNYEPKSSLQAATEHMVYYSKLEETILDVHSHLGKAYFSMVDDEDEKGLQLYAVFGLSDRSMTLRLGVYGYFYPLSFEDVFEGELVNIYREKSLLRRFYERIRGD